MSDVAALLAQLVQDSKEQKEKAERDKVELETRLSKEREDADAKLAALIAAMKQPGEVTLKAPDLDPVVVRSDKIQKLNLNMRRSQRVKPYKVSG